MIPDWKIRVSGQSGKILWWDSAVWRNNEKTIRFPVSGQELCQVGKRSGKNIEIEREGSGNLRSCFSCLYKIIAACIDECDPLIVSKHNLKDYVCPFTPVSGNGMFVFIPDNALALQPAFCQKIRIHPAGLVPGSADEEGCAVIHTWQDKPGMVAFQTKNRVSAKTGGKKNGIIIIRLGNKIR